MQSQRDLYLGADEKKGYINGSDEPGKVRWAMSSINYTKKAIEEVELELQEGRLKLPTKVATPLSSGYRPEIDSTAELDDEWQNYYQNKCISMPNRQCISGLGSY
jgi:hypothetical protein